jgi:hypothetical protein
VIASSAYNGSCCGDPSGGWSAMYLLAFVCMFGGSLLWAGIVITSCCNIDGCCSYVDLHYIIICLPTVQIGKNWSMWYLTIQPNNAIYLKSYLARVYFAEIDTHDIFSEHSFVSSGNSMSAMWKVLCAPIICFRFSGIHSFLDPSRPVCLFTITKKVTRYLLDINQFSWCSLNPIVNICAHTMHLFAHVFPTCIFSNYVTFYFDCIVWS